MLRKGIHNRWNQRFLLKEVLIRSTDYVGRDPERLADSLARLDKSRKAVQDYADGLGDEDTDIWDGIGRLDDVGQQRLRDALARVYSGDGRYLAEVPLGCWEVLLKFLLRLAYRRARFGAQTEDPPCSAQEFTENYCTALALGWLRQADKLFEIIFGLEPPSSLWSPGRFDPRYEKPREPWARFTIALACDFYGRALPPMPDHPYDSPAFDALLACWRDPDPSVLVEPLLAVCDWHTHECMYSRSDRCSKNVDFINDTLMGWPLEVHSVYRLRERLGLAIPDQLDHPLMQTPLGPYLPPQPLPADARLQRLIARGLRETPGLAELLGDAV